ncbi:hypothetical protein FKM82_018892 [Ascaphus truei]
MGTRGVPTRSLPSDSPVSLCGRAAGWASPVSALLAACQLCVDTGDREALPDRRGVVVLSLVVPLPPPEVTSSPEPDTPPSCDGSPSGISSSTTTSAAGSDGSALRSARAWARPSSAVATTGAWGG